MSHLPRFEYLAPRSLEEAVTLLAKERGEAKVIAGGTDLLVNLKKGGPKWKNIIGLKNIPNLDFVIDEGDRIKLGPLVTHDQAAHSPLLNRYTDFLSAACGDLGSYPIRCMGTVGGNVCNASPSADSTPSLLALGAQVQILGPEGERREALDAFFAGPFETLLKKDEILISIDLPKPPPFTAGVYMKIPKVTEEDESLVGLALLLTLDPSKEKIEEIRIGLGSVSQTPMRAKGTEACLRGRNPGDPESVKRAKDLVLSEICPRSRADYRRKMTGHLFEEAMRVASKKIFDLAGR